MTVRFRETKTNKTIVYFDVEATHSEFSGTQSGIGSLFERIGKNMLEESSKALNPPVAQAVST